MHHDKGKFRRILLIELEDLALDLRDSVKMYADGNVRGEVSNYVMRENTALLENEIAGLEQVCQIVRDAEVCEDEPLDALTARLRTACRTAIEQSHFPDALIGMVERKLNKVEKYIRE